MKISEDFKMVVVLNDDLPIGIKANTAAILSLSLGKKIEGLIGEDVKDKDTYIHTGLTTIPLPILKCTSVELRDIYEKIYTVKDTVVFIDITDAAQTTKNYEDYQEKLAETTNKDLQLLGIAIAGSKKIINKFTGNLALLR